jgi:poly(A) polymerase
VVEITTYRAEHYPDETRFPEVRFGVSLDDDLARRDFTANAIAADPRTGRLVDPFGGQADIALGVLRAVGDPDERFDEDPLRLLRAARFVAQLGFRIDAATEDAMGRHASALGRISQERILSELTKLLTGDYVDHGLDSSGGPAARGCPAGAGGPRPRGRRGQPPGAPGEGSLGPHPAGRPPGSGAPARPLGRPPPRRRQAADAGHRRGGEIHFFGHERVGADLAARALQRLKADKATQAGVTRLVELHGRPAAYEPDWTDSAVRRLVLEAGEVWDDLLDLAAADVTSGRSGSGARRPAASPSSGNTSPASGPRRIWPALQSPLDGDELMRRFGRGPGIWIKHVKDHLRELVIDGDLQPDDTATAERVARAFLESHPEH